MTVKVNSSGLFERIDLKRTAVSGNYTMLDTDFLLGVTSTSSAWTITIPTAVITAQAGRWICWIHDESGAAGTNNITVATEGAETINGNATVAINVNDGSMILYSDGANLYGAELAGAA